MTTITITVKNHDMHGFSKEISISTTREIDMNTIRLNKEIQNLFAQLQVARDKQK